MIIDAILGVLFSVVNAIMSTLAALIPPAPAWFTTAWEGIGTAYDYAMELDTWIPVDLALTLSGAVLLAYVASVTIQIIRTVVSYFTMGGGAT